MAYIIVNFILLAADFVIFVLCRKRVKNKNLLRTNSVVSILRVFASTVLGGWGVTLKRKWISLCNTKHVLEFTQGHFRSITSAMTELNLKEKREKSLTEEKYVC